MIKLCTKPPLSAFYLRYVVVAILYAPPGNVSVAGFSDTSTSGSSSTFTNSQGQTYSYGITFKQPVTTYKQGFTFGSGSTTGGSEQFSTSLNSASGYQIKPTKDAIDHSQDTFYLWLNAEFTPGIDPLAQAKVLMQVTSGGGPYLDIISITVAELQNPALIKPKDLNSQVIRNADGSTSTYPGLNVLQPGDFQSILALDPFLSGDPSAQPTDTRRYFDTLLRPVLEGPLTGGEQNFGTITLANSNSETLSTVQTTTYSTGVSLSLGPLSYSDTQTIKMSTTNATTSGSGQQINMVLGTSTVGCCNTSSTGMGGNCHLDVYEDLLFQTYVAIPEPYGCSGILPPGVGKPFAHPQAVQGILTNANDQPEPNTPVTVKLPNGKALKVYTNSKGEFSLYEAPDGTATLQAGNATETISIKNGTSQPTRLRLH